MATHDVPLVRVSSSLEGADDVVDYRLSEVHRVLFYCHSREPAQLLGDPVPGGPDFRVVGVAVEARKSHHICEPTVGIDFVYQILHSGTALSGCFRAPGSLAGRCRAVAPGWRWEQRA